MNKYFISPLLGVFLLSMPTLFCMPSNTLQESQAARIAAEQRSMLALTVQCPLLVSLCEQHGLDVFLFLNQVKQNYQHALLQTTLKVKNYIASLTLDQTTLSKPPIFVFDIDETLLLRSDFSWFVQNATTDATPIDPLSSQYGQPIPPMCSLFNFITAQGIETTFLTGRLVTTPDRKKQTCQALNHFKLKPSKGVMFMPEKYAQAVMAIPDRMNARRYVAEWKKSALQFLSKDYTVTGFIDDLPENLDLTRPGHFKTPRFDDVDLLVETAQAMLEHTEK